MKLRELPAVFMRGGTSKALVFKIDDLPADRTDWDAIFLAATGSPDPYGRQLDGMGGGLSSLSKVCVIGPPTRPDADVDYTFAQVSIPTESVDYAGNCGNMVSAIGPAAIDLGLVPCPPNGEACLRIHNTNTDKIIVGRFPVEDGVPAVDGDLAIDGVAGTGAPVRLDFLEPGGSKTGVLLPTGAPVDVLPLEDGRTVRASLVDAANPCVFVAATDLGKTSTEAPDALADDVDFMATMDQIRCAGSVKMGLAPDLAAARKLGSIPKVAMVAPPTAVTTLSGVPIAAEQMALLVRMISMEQPHRALPITGAICLAIATRIPGSIPQTLAATDDGPLTLCHPSGSLLVDSAVHQRDRTFLAESGTVYRTARKLFAGHVFFRDRRD
ncbi:2-methylaconitate cis-trans isomerase PrpF family protein [Amorphus sp. 3PC139-8]|uniref:2-methylaconitate cis-trans isomerase PrpF family protein n=1 Tax=Amorphus sp. 3PC139-8 TaxID=2735676 RepID=UPI00345E0316